MSQAAPSQQQWKPLPANRSKLTLRERWNRTMHFQPVDVLPNMEFRYWAETLSTWHKQGLPESVRDFKDAYAYFGIEDWGRAQTNMEFCPPFVDEVIEQGDGYLIHRDLDGAVRKEIIAGNRSIPHYLRFAIRDRKDWEALKPRLAPNTPERLPADWAASVAAWRNRDYPLAIKCGSMLGRPRNWIGFENICLMAYDDPALLEDIIETSCQCVCGVLERALKDIQPDFAAGWEDICFNSGPILSPAMIEKIIAPRWRRVNDLLRSHGIDVIWTDCDGNLWPIMDILLDSGFNCMFPIEVGAGTDPIALREKYGRRVLLQGGINKFALVEGPKAIEKELLRLRPLAEQGGFVPHLDHLCPPNVTLENYKLYLKLKREIFNAGDLVGHWE